LIRKENMHLPVLFNEALHELSIKPDGIYIDCTFGRGGHSGGILQQLGSGGQLLGPLDMRMDCTTGLSAAEWLASVTEEDLVQVLFDYGEERFARRIANAVVTQRAEKPLVTTQQFVDLLVEAIPFKEKHKHPATRSFQAVRIAVNRELEEITTVLDQAVNVLASGGIMAVISFHSLEDRIAKRFIRDESRGKYTSSKLPFQPEELAAIRLKKCGKAIQAGKQELAENPRSRSAVMRIAQRK
jgi:16S rRNA (cytosine1402-N4)-methyltransferase